MLTAASLGIRHADWILRGISFRLAPGNVLAVLGPNGRGKSSLLRALAGLAIAQEGSVRADGTMSYVPQSVTPGFEMAAQDFVLAGRARQIGWLGAPRAQDYAAAREAMRRLGVAHLAQRAVHRLSGGERQLMTMARALASGSRAMLLDEPAAALDYRNQAVILRVLRELASDDGLTIVFTTHAPEHALQIADHALLLHGPADHDFGPTADTITSASLSRLYRLPTHCARVEVDGRAVDIAIPLFDQLPMTS
ncbi:ABC transporter ATP-binding protein [Cupriavidus campinensis]